MSTQIVWNDIHYKAGYYNSQLHTFTNGLQLKFFFSVFSKLNQIKSNKAGVKLKIYATRQILYNPWIQNKIRLSVYENVKIWNSVFPYSLHRLQRHKCYFNVFSPSLHSDNYSRNNYSRITWQILSKLTKYVRNCQHPILCRNHQNWSF